MRFIDLLQLASVASFMVIFAVRASHLLLIQKINPIAIGRGKKGFDRAFELIAFSGLILWMIAVVLSATHARLRLLQLDQQIFETPVATGAGTVLVVLAIVLFALAFLSFGNSWRVGFDRQTPGELVTTGAFAFSRNPIYVALDLWFVGVALMNGTVFFLGFAMIAAGALHWQMLREEDFCAELYGEPYRTYQARTSRYLGFSNRP